MPARSRRRQRARRSASFVRRSSRARNRVFADETRPFMQGARLTAWELIRDGISTTVITESMAGPLMRAGEIDLVVVGADRIAANGDTANKIGTYTVAVLAHEHKMPFYVAAPMSTIDLATPDGDAIPIEERDQREVTHLGRVAADAGRRADPQSRVRRDAAPLHHRHHHRARHLHARRTRESLKQALEADRVDVRPDEPARDRDVVRRDGGGRRRRDRRRRAGPGDPLEHRRVAGGDPSRVGRRRPRARVAAARPRHLRRRRGGARRRRRSRSTTSARVAVTQGPGLVGLAARRRGVRQGVRLVARHSGRSRCITSPATSSRSTLAHGELPLPAAVLVVSGGHTSLYLIATPGRLPADRPDARRCGGGGVRQGGEAAGARVSGRAGDRSRSRGRATTARCDFPAARLTHADRNAPGATATGCCRRRRAPDRFQLQRPEDRRAAAGAGAHRRRAARQAGAPTVPARRSRRQSRGHLPPAFSASVVDALLDRTFEAARWLGARSIGIAGGVSANSRLRADAEGARRAARHSRLRAAARRSRPTTPR